MYISVSYFTILYVQQYVPSLTERRIHIFIAHSSTKIVQTECNKNLFLIAEVQPILCKDNHSKQKNDKNYNIFYCSMAKNSNLPDFS